MLVCAPLSALLSTLLSKALLGVVRRVAMDAIGFAFATVVTIVGVGIMFFVPTIVLRPFVRPDDTCAPPRKFTTADFFVLAFYLQLALVAGTWFATLSPHRGLQYGVSLLGCVAAVFVWFGAVESAVRSGIESEIRRAVFLIVLLPLTIVSMLTCGLAGPAIYWLLADPTNALWGEGWVAWVLPVIAPPLIVLLRVLGQRLTARQAIVPLAATADLAKD
jgi:hypothetical protein